MTHSLGIHPPYDEKDPMCTRWGDRAAPPGSTTTKPLSLMNIITMPPPPKMTTGPRAEPTAAAAVDLSKPPPAIGSNLWVRFAFVVTFICASSAADKQCEYGRS